jgi:hypothetical protein
VATSLGVMNYAVRSVVRATIASAIVCFSLTLAGVVGGSSLSHHVGLRISSPTLTNRAALNWSPDGEKIAFSINRDPDRRFKTWVMKADGSNQKMLADIGPGNPSFSQNHAPAWSPDGNKILFSGYSNFNGTRNCGVVNCAELFVMNADGSNVMPLTNDPKRDGGYVARWFPDGTKIVAAGSVGTLTDRRSGISTSTGIVVMNADGSNAVTISRRSERHFVDGVGDWQPLSAPAVTSSSVLGFSAASYSVMGRKPITLIQSGDKQSTIDENQFPIAEEAAPEPATQAERDKKNKKEKKYGRYKDTIGPGVTLATKYYQWPQGFPTLPVAQSDAVVIGEVTDAKAYVTTDKDSVYSEFTLHIVKVLKSDNQTPLSSDGSINVERPGGRVRYSSGHISRFCITGWGMPQPMRQYVLFLTKNNDGQTYHIVTGYELRNGRIFPLDRTTSNETDFDAYINMDEAAFFEKLDAAIGSSSPASPQ